MQLRTCPNDGGRLRIHGGRRVQRDGQMHRKLNRVGERSRALLAALVVWILYPSPTFLSAQSLSDETLQSIRFDQKLNAAVSGSLIFRDEMGRDVELGAYLGARPIVLILGYYQCPMLCTLVLNGLLESATD